MTFHKNLSYYTLPGMLIFYVSLNTNGIDYIEIKFFYHFLNDYYAIKLISFKKALKLLSRAYYIIREFFPMFVHIYTFYFFHY